MSTFTDKEIEYLRGQRLGRLATVGRDGSPHVVPVGFRVGPEQDAIEIGGHGLKDSKKWRDLEASPRVAFVIDDLERIDPWTPRGLTVRGHAELHEQGGERFGSGWDAAWIRILPKRIVSWGIEGHASRPPGGAPLARSATADHPSRRPPLTRLETSPQPEAISTCPHRLGRNTRGDKNT